MSRSEVPGASAQGDADEDRDDPLLNRLRRLVEPDYTVNRRVAAGGMGIVFLGRDPALDMPVAIKVLRPEQATATASERFLREAKLLAAFQHPSVVTIHRVSKEDSELLYFVMEWLDSTLADRLRGGPLPAATVCQIAEQVLDGLEQVHKRGTVHRDIKPSNIFFVDGRAKVGDFGIARGDGPPLTLDGPAPVTIAYAAPEQLRGETVDHRADLYALSLVCYEALTGHRKRFDQSATECDWAGVPTKLRRVLQRGLAFDRDDRWPDAKAFKEAVGEAAQPPGVNAGLVGGLVVAVLAFLLAVVWHNRPQSLESEVAVLPFSVNGVDSALQKRLAIGIEDDLERAWSDSSGIRVTSTKFSIPWWQDTGADSLPTDAFAVLHTRRILRGHVSATGDSMDVSAELVEPDGEAQALGRVRVALGNLMEAECRIAGSAARAISGRTSTFRCIGQSPAWRALIEAEYAVEHDNWSAADSGYRRALELDPQLALATWGLYNVRRWERITAAADVDSLAAAYARRAGSFGRLERLLVEADLAPTVPRRLAIYDTAIREFPFDGYPRLLRGNELFHRGALAGKGLDSAIVALDSAAAVNPYLSPTYTMLAWAYTRRGDSALARDAFHNYERRGNAEPVAHFCMRCVFRLALAMRFFPRDAALDTLRDVRTTQDGPGSLALAVRLGLAFGVPWGQVTIGEILSATAPAPMNTQGLVAQSLALLAMGRIEASLGKLEAATTVSGDDEYGFQAMQWRVVLPALGLPGFDATARETGRAAMARIDSGPRASRARWTLVVDAIARDSLEHARTLLEGLPERAALRQLGGALLASARGDTGTALAWTDSLTNHVVVAELEDPLERAVLFLSRGRWLTHRDPQAADAAWRWYENADAHGWPGWPSGDAPQAAELDWALETYARYLRADLAQSRGDQRAVCALVPDAHARWETADPAYAPLERTLDRWLTPCSRRQGGGRL